MIFYTSELMLNDNEYLSKSTRHFSSVLKMHNTLISSWNSIVSDSDDVYIIGGVGDYEFLKALNGNKRLIMSDYERTHFNSCYRDWETDRKSTRLNSSHRSLSRMPSSA